MEVYFMRFNRKKELAVIIIGICVSVIVCGVLFYTNNKSYQSSISDKILRFHVIANSDSDADQNVKLKVRDGVLEYLAPYFESCETKENCENIVIDKKSDIKQKAEEILLREGFDETVNVELTNRYFPVKSYGNYTFPEGQYEALCIEIGEAKGKNWWCVLYPRLCFLDSAYAVVPDESQEQLKRVLSDEEYDSLFTDKDKKIVIKSKTLEWLKIIK